MPRYRVPIILEVEGNSYSDALFEAERIGKILLYTTRVRFMGLIAPDSVAPHLRVGAGLNGEPRWQTDIPATTDTETTPDTK